MTGRSSNVATHADGSAEPREPDGAESRSWTSAIAISRFSGVYLLLALIGLFGILIPETFFTKVTLISILGTQAVTLLLAIGLLFPLAAGAFDLSVGAMLGLGGIVSSYLVVNGMDTGTAILIAVLVGVLVGGINALLIVGFQINSFIATLGMSSVLLAVTSILSKQEQIFGISEGLVSFGGTRVFGEIPIAVFYVTGIAIVAWYVLAHTSFGRQLFAIGGGREVARLAGVRTNLYTAIALVVSGACAALAGTILAGILGAGSPTVGPGYLLPAYAAAFLGATQVTPGRYNVWGTVIAVYLLGTGATGLQLSGAGVWVTDMFNGVVLLVAVGLAELDRRRILHRTRKRVTAADQKPS